jgi:hypothetical protein
VDKEALLKKLGALLDEAARSRAWVVFEIDVRNGVPTLLRRNQTEKLTEEQPRAYHQR